MLSSQSQNLVCQDFDIKAIYGTQGNREVTCVTEGSSNPRREPIARFEHVIFGILKEVDVKILAQSTEQ
jgi:hypothetical protein